jgi:hypothetical protein
LYIQAGSILYTIMYHAGRLFTILAFKKKAALLGFIILFKALLLIWDVFTNGLLLYEVLIPNGITLCSSPSKPVTLVLAVISVSPLVTLGTNVIVNVPLHFTFLRFLLNKPNVKDAEADAAPYTCLGESVSFWRVLKAALRKAFHPIISVCCFHFCFFFLPK